MRSFKQRALCLLLTLSLIFALSSVTVFAADEADTGAYLGRDILSRMPRGEVLVSLYDSMRSGFLNMDEEIPYNSSDPLTTEEMRAVYDMTMADCPQCFWINGISVYSNAIIPEYLLTKEEAEEKTKQLEAKAEELCRPLEGLSDYETALALHDEIIKNTVYERTDNDQNAYGALVEGEAVCAGYAAAYQYLMNKMNIPVLNVTGESVDPDSGKPIPHAWSFVKLDGDFYLTDVTWDDHYTPGNEGSHIYHEFFNRTTAYFEDSHIPDAIYRQYLPECTAEKDNYFTKNNGYISETDAFFIASKLAEGEQKTSLCLTDGYTFESFSADYRENLKEIVSLLGINKSSVNFSVMHMVNEVVLGITSEVQPDLPSLSVAVSSSEAIPEDCTLEISHGGKTLRTVSVPSDGALQLDRLIPGDYTLTVTGGEDTVSTDITLSEDASVKMVLKEKQEGPEDPEKPDKPEEPEVIVGDLDKSGTVTLKDSCIMKSLILFAVEADDELFKAADLNKDNRIDTRDSFMLKKIIYLGSSSTLD